MWPWRYSGQLAPIASLVPRATFAAQTYGGDSSPHAHTRVHKIQAIVFQSAIVKEIASDLHISWTPSPTRNRKSLVW